MYRVVIADDEPKVSQLIKNLIEWEKLGLQHVATAHDGISALELIKEHKPDIVITDIRMPGYDGIELIRYTKEIDPDIDFIIISGYQYFDYAHNAIKYGVKDYLLKPLNKNEINAALSKMVEKYSEKSLMVMQHKEDVKRIKNELLRSIYTDLCMPPEAEEGLAGVNREYGTSFIEGCYQALVIKPDFEYQPNNQEMMRMLLAKIYKISEQNLQDICAESLLLSMDDRIFIIANYKNEDKKLFRKALSNIIDESHMLRDVFKNLMVTIGTGCVRTDLIQICQSTVEAKASLNDRIIAGGGKMIQYSPELHLKERTEPIVSFENRRKLVGLIEIFDAEGIGRWIKETEGEMLKLQGISGQFILDAIDEILEIILYGLKNHANIKTIDKALINEFREALSMQNGIRGAFDVTGSYMCRMLLQAADERRNESNRPIKDAQKYINEHYASQVTLEEVSNLVGFNPTYFSTLFKKETGMNFLEYVTAARIKAAKQQLSDSRKSILDISLEVGYSDLKHFTKQFKKVTGLTPSEYRKLYY